MSQTPETFKDPVDMSSMEMNEYLAYMSYMKIKRNNKQKQEEAARIQGKREMFKTQQRLELETYDISGLRSLCLDVRMKDYDRLEQTNKPHTTSSNKIQRDMLERCQVRMWTTKKGFFTRCKSKGIKGSTYHGICCNQHIHKLVPSNDDSEILLPVLGWWYQEAPTRWNQYSLFGIPKGYEDRDCQGRVDLVDDEEGVKTNPNTSQRPVVVSAITSVTLSA